MFGRFKYFLQVLYTPNSWARIGAYDAEWDTELRAAFSERIIIKDRFTAKVGKYEVWIENHPYGSGNQCSKRTAVLHTYPSRTTAMELRDLLEKNIVVQVLDGSLPANFKLSR